MTEWRAHSRRPAPLGLEHCELTHLERQPVDPDRLALQHERYVRALRDLGLEVEILEPLPDHPDALFVEDLAIVLDELAVITRPGAESRRGEAPEVESALAAHRPLERIAYPGTVEGGDVLVLEDALHVGRSERSNAAGISALAELLAPLGYRVEALELHGCLHLKSAVCSLGDGRLLMNPRWIRSHDLGGSELIEVDPREPYGANVLAVGGTLLCSDAYPRTNERLSRLGYDLLELDLSELHKMEAAVTCPSLVFRA